MCLFLVVLRFELARKAVCYLSHAFSPAIVKYRNTTMCLFLYDNFLEK
jgi:hypothetical protein